MLKADKLNDLNGSPAFGVSKFADRTEEGLVMIRLSYYHHCFPLTLC